MKNLNRTSSILKTLIVSLFMIGILNSGVSQSFKSQQLKNERVKKAYSDKEETLLKRYKKVGFNSLSQNLFFRAFKESGEFELWVYSVSEKKYILVHTYDICEKSGELGPKRKMGDLQVPEGFYSITQFNPFSSYFLSLRVSYPNTSDRILGKGNNLGGDIFIHGNCVTIGCLPLTDDFIKEVYIACVEAKNLNNLPIQIHIFPYRMNAENHQLHSKKAKKSLVPFWNNLKEGFDRFEQKKTLPIITIDKQGKYVFK